MVVSSRRDCLRAWGRQIRPRARGDMVLVQVVEARRSCAHAKKKAFWVRGLRCWGAPFRYSTCFGTQTRHARATSPFMNRQCLVPHFSNPFDNARGSFLAQVSGDAPPEPSTETGQTQGAHTVCGEAASKHIELVVGLSHAEGGPIGRGTWR
eukprot:174515-Rhodomonas_salina.1